MLYLTAAWFSRVCRVSDHVHVRGSICALSSSLFIFTLCQKGMQRLIGRFLHDDLLIKCALYSPRTHTITQVSFYLQGCDGGGGSLLLTHTPGINAGGQQECVKQGGVFCSSLHACL